MTTTHLLILSDRAALSWVLTEQRMAFPARRSRQSRALTEGDEIMLYTTRGCFRNPTRDLGRVIALAEVSGPVRVLDEEVRLGGRRFPEGCPLQIRGLAPFREGLVLRDLVPSLTVFPDPATWSIWLRRSSLPLPAGDAELLRNALRPLLRPYAETVDQYRWGSAGR
ncbi:hypothetical protein [Actinacidiphila soli]|uniref:hypothetical protein n=1 Tax=Actinacidiphila soli TaxID=2487275 RepID=UPI000FCC8AEE|nr:hypothetical protein [Actinacidiphila soli]